MWSCCRTFSQKLLGNGRSHNLGFQFQCASFFTCERITRLCGCLGFDQFPSQEFDSCFYRYSLMQKKEKLLSLIRPRWLLVAPGLTTGECHSQTERGGAGSVWLVRERNRVGGVVTPGLQVHLTSVFIYNAGYTSLHTVTVNTPFNLSGPELK